MNSNIDFQSVCLGTILYSSTEIIDFSWQLYFFLVNFKSEIWQIYVIRRHHCQSTRGSCLPLLIFSYKGISILYYSMVDILHACLSKEIFILFYFHQLWIFHMDVNGLCERGCIFCGCTIFSDEAWIRK